jgi:hypothetical protein
LDSVGVGNDDAYGVVDGVLTFFRRQRSAA